AAGASPPVTRMEPSVGPTGGGSWSDVASPSVAGMWRCPACQERVGRESECPHCGVELPDQRLGETLGQRYRVERLLGAGGMGRVYLGTQLAFDEPVAIKFLLAEWTSRGEFRARFRREAMTLAKLRHPGIVTVHDYGEHEGELYMVMEFVKGRDLRGSVPEGEAVPAPRALHLIDLVLQVIEFAHAHGIVHRDLKPENAMMLDLGDGVDRVKVLDFGLALATNTVAADRLTATDTVQGTPAYMSPEQCKGRDVGPPTDIYALGVMLYEWLCGDVPFGGGAVSETMAQQMYLAPPSLADRGHRPSIPAPVEALVRSALAKQPEARPTATEFRARIAEILRGDDAVSRAERDATRRTGDAGLARDQRLRIPAGGTATPVVVGAGAATVSGCVIVWGATATRATDLSTNFAVNGCAVKVWSQDDIPPSTVEGQAVKAILVQWNPAVPQRIQAIRACADLTKVAVVVLDTPEVDATPALIRAGATDVQYTATGADAICKQTLKLMRRVK
ncbi:MAG: serine/threonine-protein kinase, partial [Deltaproteobacteria bacterium]